MPKSDDRLSQIRDHHGKCNPRTCDQAWLLANLAAWQGVSTVTVYPVSSYTWSYTGAVPTLNLRIPPKD